MPIQRRSPAAQEQTDIAAALTRAIRGRPGSLDAHLTVLERDLAVEGTHTTLHAYFLPLDGNGRVRFKPLAEFLRDRIVDYAIPRRTIEQAKREADASGSTAPILKLVRQAENLFTNLANSGEGGELLLFAMAEAVFGFAQILCKMSLKTSPQVHYHGADGVYAEAREDGGLNIFWAESKVFGDATAAIRECLESLAPFLVEPEGADAKRSQDILLVNEFANFTDERLVEGLRRALDTDHPTSLTTRHCGFALVAFDCDSYSCAPEPTLAQIQRSLHEELTGWSASVSRRINHEQLHRFDVHFICVPMPSAADFRAYFLELLGVRA